MGWSTLAQGFGLLAFLLLLLLGQAFQLQRTYARRTARDGAVRTACHGDTRRCESVVDQVNAVFRERISDAQRAELAAAGQFPPGPAVVDNPVFVYGVEDTPAVTTTGPRESSPDSAQGRIDRAMEWLEADRDQPAFRVLYAILTGTKLPEPF